jgi:hypothetical protein
MHAVVSCLVIVIAAPNAMANINFGGAIKIDAGSIHPSVTKGTFAGPTSWEVYTDANSNTDDSLRDWAFFVGGSTNEGQVFDHGANSASCALGEHDIVEVHQAGAGPNPIWYRHATVNFDGSNPDVPTVTWDSSSFELPFSNGSDPHCASDQNGDLAITYEDTSGVLQLYWTTGTTSAPYTFQGRSGSSGYKSQLAMSTTAIAGDIILLDVHQSTTAGNGQMWYTSYLLTSMQLGTITSAEYDVGENPSVVLHGNKVVEVHDSGAGEVWYRTATMNADATLTWDTLNNGNHANKYDNGWSPVIAIDPFNGSGVEVHQAGSGWSAIWLHRFTAP